MGKSYKNDCSNIKSQITILYFLTFGFGGFRNFISILVCPLILIIFYMAIIMSVSLTVSLFNALFLSRYILI